MIQTTDWLSLHFQPSTSITWPSYVDYLSRLLPWKATAVTPPLQYHEPDNGRSQWPFTYWHTRFLVAKAKESIIVVKRPRWPLRQILLIVRGEDGDETAVSWAIRLAQASHATVIIMPIIPAWPSMYHMGNEVQADLAILRLPNTATGQRLRNYQSQLEQAGIPHHFCQQFGTPNQQIWSEVTESEPDLIVIGAERGRYFHRWYLGQIVAPLLRWLNHPVLIAK